MASTPVAPPGLSLASALSATGNWCLWPGGDGSFIVAATGSGTVKLQVMGADAGASGLDVGTDTTITTFPGGGNFKLPMCYIRANIATATAVYAVACPIVVAN